MQALATAEVHAPGAAGHNPPMDNTPARDPLAIAGLLQAEGLAGRRVAVEVNGEIVARAAHDSLALQAGDRVEIVHALGGG